MDILVFLAVKAVNLSREERIRSRIMRRKVEFPRVALRKTVDGAHHAANEFGIINQKQRDRRIAHVHRRGTAVGETFLRGEKKLALFGHAELVCGKRLTVGKLEHFGIFLAAGANAVEEKSLGKLFAGKIGLFIAVKRFGKSFFDGFSLVIPNRRNRLAEVIKALYVVVGKEHQRFLVRERNGDADSAHIVVKTQRFGVLAAGGEIKIAPVDAHIVTRTV